MKGINHDLLAPLGMVGLIILTGAFLTLPNTNADDSSVVTATITVPVSCSMTGTGMNSHTAEIPNGIDSRGSDYYPNGIGQTTLKAFCNDNEGFSIYAVGYTGDTIGNTYLRDANLGQTDDIQTGTTFSGNSSNWAMKLGVTSGTYTPIIAGSTADTERQSGDTDYSGWAVVPSTHQRVAYRNSGTDIDNSNVQAEGASVTATYAAYISPTQKAGTYVGQVKYTLVHPKNEVPLQPQTTEAGCIRYYPNGGNVEGTMGCQTISASATSATLLASNFSREGYGFAGWSKTYDYSDTTGFLGPQEYITFTAGQYTGNNNGLSLYAHWIKSTGNLQGWTGCSSMTSGAVTALTDQRDGETYAIAKLADGNCWMIENLRLENTNSDNSAGTLAQGYGGQFAGLANPETLDKFKSTYSANSLYSNDGSNNTINIGTNNTAYRIPRYNNLNTPTNPADRPQNPTGSTATNTTSNASMYSYGNYYTWAAAIANTTAYTTNNQSVASSSICPSGWHLPKGGDESNEANNEFWSLIVTGINNGTNPANYGSNAYPYYTGTTEGTDISRALRVYPNNFIYSGYIYDGSVGNRGSYGRYWSSTTYSSGSSYYLYITSSAVYPGTCLNNYSVKYSGWTIRCLAPNA